MAGFHLGSRFPRSIWNDVGEDESFALHRLANRVRDRRRKHRSGGDRGETRHFRRKPGQIKPDRALQQRSAPLTGAERMDAARNDCLSGSVIKYVWRSARSDFRRCQPPKDLER